MFTGIIEEVGRVSLFRKQGRCFRLGIDAEKALEATKIGDSISVSGVCLTVVAIEKGRLYFDVMPETTGLTTLKNICVGTRVNLERALKVGDRLGGHFVLGHADCCGVIRSKKISRGNLEFSIGVPAKFLKYITHKGSVAVDGISLTIADVRGASFSVCIIPLTARVTTLGFKHAGDKVNVELDMLAKL
ncbi:MAG TPA: riboflavin synthase [Candidatus Omnitrophica bacterium]|nr:riboflavin synthase [Candidatus Omnitrophota bacterium]